METQRNVDETVVKSPTSEKEILASLRNVTDRTRELRAELERMIRRPSLFNGLTHDRVRGWNSAESPEADTVRGRKGG